MVFLPRIARTLHHPGLAGLLGVVLLGVCAIGLLSGEIPTGWSILIGVVGAINLLRLIRHPSEHPPRVDVGASRDRTEEEGPAR